MERLPQYMIPSAFVLLDQLPLNANGKIDRQALEAAIPTAHAGDTKAGKTTPDARPLTQTERTLGAIWAELLKVDSVGLNDDFFDLGGHSLLAISVVSRVRDAFEVDLPLRNLFERPTLSALAEAIDALGWSANAPAASRAQQPGGAGAREEIAV